MDKRLLITGFDPFGGNSTNPSWMAVEQLPDRIGSFMLRKCMLPTVYGKAAKIAIAEAESFHSDVVLCIGLAANRRAVTPERIGVNIRDARIADNAGNQPQGEPVVPGAPAAYFTTVPNQAMVQAMADLQLPAAVSNSAGTFVCNDVLYSLLHHFHNTPTRVGFIHVPALPSQAESGMALEQIIAALTASIKACQ